MIKKQNTKTKKTAQEIQDEIFRKMSAGKKIKLVSELTSFCLKLSQLKKNRGVRKTFNQNSQDS